MTYSCPGCSVTDIEVATTKDDLVRALVPQRRTGAQRPQPLAWDHGAGRQQQAREDSPILLCSHMLLLGGQMVQEFGRAIWKCRSFFLRKDLKNVHPWDFPGGPVVRTPRRFHCRGPGFHP